MHIFHKWEQWEVTFQKDIHNPYITGEEYIRIIHEQRKCSICGLVQYKTTEI